MNHDCDHPDCHRYSDSNDREELNAALEMIAELRAEIAKLRKQLDEACSGEKD